MKKSLKIITIALIVVLIMLVSTLGIFVQHLNRMENIVPEYKLASELVGTRNYTLEVDTTEKTETVYYDSEGKKVENVTSDTDTSKYTSEEKVVKTNEDDVLTKDNYEKVKSIMEARLDKLEVKDYDIRLDSENGTIILSVPDDTEADSIYNSAASVGKFEIVDKDTGEVLMTNADLAKAEAVYNTQTTGTTVYLQLEFNKEGKEKLRKISTEYVAKEVEKESAVTEAMENSDENSEEKEKETIISYVKVTFDDSPLLTTYFGEEMTNGILQIPITRSLNETDKINDALKSIRKIADILNSGKLPVAYKLSNDNFVESRVSVDMKNVGITAFEIVNAVLIIVLIARNGKKGLLGAISYIGFATLMLILIRYTNVVLTIGGCLTILFMDVLYFIFLQKFMKNLKTTKFVKKAFNTSGLEALIRIVPMIIVSLVFTLTNNIALSSIGMVAFWGIIVAIIYSIVITKPLYNANED